MKTQTSDELWAATGEMLKQIHGLETVDVGMFDAVLRNPQENVTAPSAREQYVSWARQTAEGHVAEPLSPETCWALGGEDDVVIPDDVCTLLGVPIGTEFGFLFESM
jgi:hypothetical protein